MTRRRWPRPSKASGSSATTCASRIRSGSDRSGWRRDEGRAHAGAGGGGHRDARSLPRAAFRSTPPWAAVGTPSGSWRRPTLMAASSVSMPMGRPIARVDDRLRPRFGDRLVLRQANFRELATVAPAAGFGAVDGCLFDLGLSSFQLADTRPRLRLPGRRSARHALRHEPRRPGRRAARDARRRRADRALPTLRRGAEGRRGSPGRSSTPGATAPIAHRRGAGRARRARRCRPTRASRAGPIRRRASSRRCASRSTRSSMRSRPASRAAARPAAAGRPARRPQLPLARGPHRQAVLRRGAARLRLPARGAGLRLRPRTRACAWSPDRR